MTLVSVIVPIYNVEVYLDRCINSLRNQTHQNIELILVNDGSPDDSQLIIDKHAASDSRIRAVKKENGGLSFHGFWKSIRGQMERGYCSKMGRKTS